MLSRRAVLIFGTHTVSHGISLENLLVKGLKDELCSVTYDK